MKRFLCCLVWWLTAAFLVLAYILCLIVFGIFLGPRRAHEHCQPILDKMRQLADCCAGKTE
ncbi:hypothetical protein G3N55_10705 [Dissulfurirhabdus thermomarina]|uniref:Uncharacterized protein n=1 Tax=Dissulfurirhabdus thermomarina TaxID=1765737 RepID=A0A6N9TQI0_DISTH|nr:hypothetical protein [Dissulfurirhabdus thermomarina]NDY43308.1 hypothetical protein [Dissulfurirhabdus thermomarina]NMX23507.1 hypothetical protein [Dissulfurirhabdus thermomarina]